MSILEMHYAPGVLALLRRVTCPRDGEHGHGHSSCHCDRQHQIFTVAKLHVLQPDEADWVWHRCPTAHQADV